MKKELKAQTKVGVGIETLWKALVKDLRSVLPKVVPNLVRNINYLKEMVALALSCSSTLAQENVKSMTYQKEKIVELDEAHHRFGIQVIEGGHLTFGYASYITIFQMTENGETETLVDISVIYETVTDEAAMPKETTKSALFFITCLEKHLMENDDDSNDHVDPFQEGGNGLRAHIAVISSGSDHFDVFALKTDGDDHKDYESDNCEELSLEEVYSQLVSQLEKLKNEKQSLSGQLKTCEQNRLIAVEKVKLGEIEIEKLILELTSTQQKLEVFYHGAKNIDKILSMSKNGSDKRGLGFDEQNVKSTSSQVTKFVKATSTSFLPKPSIIDASHRQTEQPFVFHVFYCEACGRKGHLAPYCRYVPQLRGM
ncbi:hypothetical protein GIB67_002502 [Kingdonia uniflora]|uniref:Bet v I/Major latex protein domain-containing protein n=1 Tax=Kingdonia uniflora TaxID=39325 RepID=A0A7J7LAM4_9MAGN|nr:hypothetical protein GIB67_002502 [Kingdonia uniflora]